MTQNTTLGADTRTSFIETFATGDKSAALRSLVAAAHSSSRLDDFPSDDFIYEALASGHIAGPFETKVPQAVTA